MSDLISRQAVLEVLKKNRFCFNISQEGYWSGKVLWSENLIKDDAYKEIEQLPSITPKEKTGYWINAKVGKLFPSNDFKCSECGNILDFDGVNCGRGDTNYCPNCGARMEVENADSN